MAINDYFAQHVEQFIHLSDLVKELGAKRGEVQRIHADAPWARMVDTTFLAQV